MAARQTRWRSRAAITTSASGCSLSTQSWINPITTGWGCLSCHCRREMWERRLPGWILQYDSSPCGLQIRRSALTEVRRRRLMSHLFRWWDSFKEHGSGAADLWRSGNGKVTEKELRPTLSKETADDPGLWSSVSSFIIKTQQYKCVSASAIIGLSVTHCNKFHIFAVFQKQSAAINFFGKPSNAVCHTVLYFLYITHYHSFVFLRGSGKSSALCHKCTVCPKHQQEP